MTRFKPNKLTKFLAWTPIPILGDWTLKKVITYDIAIRNGIVDPIKRDLEVIGKRALVYTITAFSILSTYEILKVNNIINPNYYIEEVKEGVIYLIEKIFDSFLTK